MLARWTGDSKAKYCWKLLRGREKTFSGPRSRRGAARPAVHSGRLSGLSDRSKPEPPGCLLQPPPSPCGAVFRPFSRPGGTPARPDAAASAHAGPRRHTSRTHCRTLYANNAHNSSERAFPIPRTRNFRTPKRSFNQALGHSAVSARFRYAARARAVPIQLRCCASNASSSARLNERQPLLGPHCSRHSHCQQSDSFPHWC